MPFPPTAAETQGGRLDLHIARQRQRPNTDFGSLMRRGASAGVGALNTHTGVGYLLPGGALLSAAIERAGQLSDTAPTAALGHTATDVGGAGPAAPTAAAGSAASAGDLMAATERMQAQNQRFSLQFLALQNKVNTEGQHTSAVSNIMKKRDQTLTNVIQNVR